jgi:spermidine synthase
MLGLGVGSYMAGIWSDSRYALRRGSLLRAYGYFELIIGALGLGVSVLLPHLDRLSALVSSYARESSGWYGLSVGTYIARGAIAVLLLSPITLLMGGTLTLLVRHLVRDDLAMGARRIAALYAVNTAGAALGCFVTDFLLVPTYGLQATQIAAVAFNVVAGIGALVIADRGLWIADAKAPRIRKPSSIPNPQSAIRQSPPALVAATLALTGFAAMGMEILWFRHFTILLGQLRSVFSLLLTVILVGIGAGSLASAPLNRRAHAAGGADPAIWLIVVQGLFVAATLIGLATADASSLAAIVAADPAFLAAAGRASDAASIAGSPSSRAVADLWFNARPMLIEVAVPALLMGFAFPLANAIVQRAEASVGRRAGALYLANTCGAVCGSLATGFVLLPSLGLQTSATVLMIVATIAVVPLMMVVRRPFNASGPAEAGRHKYLLATGSLLVAGMAIAVWLRLPSDYLNTRALRPANDEHLLAVSEGLNEIIAITEMPGQGRRLLTNGHPMSATTMFSQRYMRALAHVPLLSMDRPTRVLVIGFGVGNTTHAATLHPSVTRVEVADLSRDVLAHAGYFSDVNGDVLADPRVAVYINDGRHHLQMRPAASYDLVTLEPPPIGYAGMASLYSREFYALARTRLSAQGYMTQWLPAYQVPTDTALAMVRAFVDVFPNAVLLSGAEADLLLMGSPAPRVEIDPERIVTALARAPAVRRDLEKIDLGGVREIAGMFVGASQRLASATRGIDPVTDDRPIQEYGVRSLLNMGDAVPSSLADLSEVGTWCPRCFAGNRPAPVAAGLDAYLALLRLAYSASPAELARVRRMAEREPRTIGGSRYLGAIVPDSGEVHNVLGISLAERGEMGRAVAEFREAARLDPDSASTHWHLGAALATEGARDEAVVHLRRAVELDPTNANARHDLDVVLASLRRR